MRTPQVGLECKSMTRRTFGCVVAGSLAASLDFPATAQSLNAIRRIGVLEDGAPVQPQEVWRRAEPLRQLGWLEGGNLLVDRRYDAHAQDEVLQRLAEELVRSRVELIVALGTRATLAAKRATTTIPIIASVGDAEGFGLVASLARPGGNVTGVSMVSADAFAKSLSLLKQVLPELDKLAVLWLDGQPYQRFARSRIENT